MTGVRDLRSNDDCMRRDEETHDQKENRIKNSLKTKWGESTFHVYYGQIESDYWTPYTPEFDLRRHKERVRDTYTEFSNAFIKAYRSIETRTDLILDATLFGQPLDYITFYHGSSCAWDELTRITPSCLESISKIINIPIADISNYANYKKTEKEIFDSIQEQKSTDKLKTALEYTKKFEVDINTIKSWKEELTIIEYLLIKGNYDILEKFKIIISAGFKITDSEKLLRLVCEFHANNVALLTEAIQYCDSSILNCIRTERLTLWGRETVNPITLLLSSFEKYAKGKNLSYEPYVQSIGLLLSKSTKIDREVIDKLLKCSDEPRMKSFLILFLNNSNVLPEDKTKINEKLKFLDELIKKEIADEQKREHARFRQYADKMHQEAIRNQKIEDLLKTYLIDAKFKLDTFSYDFRMKFESKSNLDLYCQKLKEIGISAEISINNSIILKEYPHLLFNKLDKQLTSSNRISDSEPKNLLLDSSLSLFHDMSKDKKEDSSISLNVEIEKKIKALFGVKSCTFTTISTLSDWHTASFSDEEHVETLKKGVDALSNTGLAIKLQPASSIMGYKIPAKVVFEVSLDIILKKLNEITLNSSASPKVSAIRSSDA